MAKAPQLSSAPIGGEALWLLHRIYGAFPYLLRRILTVLLLMAALLRKPLVNAKRPVPTTRDRLYTLSFWGVPAVEEAHYELRVQGAVARDLVLSLPQIEEMADTDREVVLDCVGGSRNVVRMKGLSLQRILDFVEPGPEAETAVFRCADGYHEAAPLSELLEREAFIAVRVNEEGIREMGYPFLLAFPGKYGYKWAKWVREIEIVAGRQRGYWEAWGLPDRGNVGDIF